jgi:hypothetical protein
MNMQRILAFVAFLLAVAVPRASAQEVEFALLEGWARVVTAHGTHWLTESARGLVVDEGAYFELGPTCRLEVVDGARASFVFSGTTSAELRRLPSGAGEVYLRRFHRASVHGRAAGSELLLPQGQRIVVGASIVHLDADPRGNVLFEHVLGASVELDIGGWYTFELGVGTRRVLPAPQDGAPAARRRADFRRVVPMRGPSPLPPLEDATRGAVLPEGARDGSGVLEPVRRALLDASRTVTTGLRGI